MSKPALGLTQPLIQLAWRFFCLGVKRPGRDVENSPQFRPEFKNKWIYTSFPHMPSWDVQEHLYLFTVNYYIGETLETLQYLYIEFL